MKIRIKFSKHGNMKFIGHLDIMRYFQKAIRRAEIDIVYSEGFSPHQKISFAAPLGVGLLSEGEYMDIEVHTSKPSQEMIKALNAVMAEGIEIISYKLLPENSKNAMSLVAAADYMLQFRETYKPEDFNSFQQTFLEFINQPELRIIKKTKKGEHALDLKPLLYAAKVQGENIFLCISTGSSDNIKPELVMETYYHYIGQVMPKFAFQVTRLEVYANMGNNEERKLVPLESFGKDIV